MPALFYAEEFGKSRGFFIVHAHRYSLREMVERYQNSDRITVHAGGIRSQKGGRQRHSAGIHNLVAGRVFADRELGAIKKFIGFFEKN